MAISKVILNGETLIDTTDKTVTSSTLVSPQTALGADGTTVIGALVQKSASDITVSDATTTIPAGVYSSQIQKTVSSGTATTPATTIGTPITMSVNSNGLVTASYSGSASIAPTITPGYISSGTAGTVTTTGSNTLQLTSQAASTWTPTTTSQTISSGIYLTGNQTIAGDSNLLASNIASGVSIFGVNGTFQGGGDLGSITIKPENCVSSSTQITPETYICETDSSYPGTVISYNNTNQNDIGQWLNNSIKIELNKTYHCNGQLLIKWDNDNTEEYYYIDSNFKITSYTNLVSLPFTWEGSTGAVQTFGTIYIKLSVQPYGYQTIIRMTALGAINKSGVLLPDSFYRIIQPGMDGYETINLDFNSDPRFLNIYKSLAYRSVINSSAAGVSEWCNSLSSISSRQFAGQNFSGNFNFSNVTYIGQNAFAMPDFGGLNGAFPYWAATFPALIDFSQTGTFTLTRIQEVNCPLVTSIGSYAFQSCSSLTTISFPKCTTIGMSAFESCTELNTISFSECITIGDYAFRGCSRLTTISFSKCTSIYYNAFQNCYSLTTVSFPECTAIGGSAFQSCNSLTTISFPKCTSIGYYTFANCTRLTTISFPECTEIKNYVFQGCSSLTTASFPKCTAIGSSAFISCSGLTTISFPECTSISYYAFRNCYLLATISFPKCISISSYAFQSCSSLSQAYFMGSSIPSIGAYIFSSTPMALSTYLGYFGSIYVPASLLDSYKTATNWTTYSNRMVGI